MMLLLLPFIGLMIALITCILLGKRYFKDLAAFIGGIFLAHYIWLFMSTDTMSSNKWALSAVYSLYYGIACFFIFLISIRLLKSRLLLAVLSWGSASLALYLSISNARKIALTERVFGYDIYINGIITHVGIIYKMANPLGIMAGCATVWVLGSIITRNLRISSYSWRNKYV